MQLICPEISGFLEDTAQASRRQLLLVNGKGSLCLCVRVEGGCGGQTGVVKDKKKPKRRKRMKAMVFPPSSIKQTSLKKKPQQAATKSRRSLQRLSSQLESLESLLFKIVKFYIS